MQRLHDTESRLLLSDDPQYCLHPGMMSESHTRHSGCRKLSPQPSGRCRMLVLDAFGRLVSCFIVLQVMLQ